MAADKKGTMPVNVNVEEARLDKAVSSAIFHDCQRIAGSLSPGTYHRKGTASQPGFVASNTNLCPGPGRRALRDVQAAMTPALEAIAQEDPAHRRIADIHVMDGAKHFMRKTVLVYQGQTARVLVVGGSCEVTFNIGRSSSESWKRTLADGTVLNVAAPSDKNVTIAAKRTDDTIPVAIAAFVRGIIV